GYEDVDGALERLDKLEGPDWFKIFVNYHKALIAEQAGRDELTRKTFVDLIADMASGGSAPDTYLRGVEAYARYLARLGEKEPAIAVLEKSKEFVTGRLQ